MIARNLVGPGWGNAHSFKYRYVLDHLTRLADERLGLLRVPQGALRRRRAAPGRRRRRSSTRPASTRWRYGGKWGIPEDATILFFGGNPQPNKGLEETIAALKAIDGTVKARLVIVGRDETHPYTKKLIDLGRGKVIGPRPPAVSTDAGIPGHRRHRRRCPRRVRPSRAGYIPCKIYEAMAMAGPGHRLGHLRHPTHPRRVRLHRASRRQRRRSKPRSSTSSTHPDEAREMGRRARAPSDRAL